LVARRDALPAARRMALILIFGVPLFALTC